MSTILLVLRTVHENVHDFTMKLNCSDPRIFTGSVDLSQWSQLSTAEQKIALDKDWYISYSFRDPQTNSLKRQSNIKAGLNKFKTKMSALPSIEINRFITTIHTYIVNFTNDFR